MKPGYGRLTAICPNGQKSNNIKIFNSAAAVAAVRHTADRRRIAELAAIQTTI
jgi:hypothetical protein